MIELYGNLIKDFVTAFLNKAVTSPLIVSISGVNQSDMGEYLTG